MDSNAALRCLEVSWRGYLEEKGHYVYESKRAPGAISSRNSKKNRYRWLLLAAQTPYRILTRYELLNVRRHLRQAKAGNEAVYLVVGFQQDPRRIVAVPAKTVLKTRRIYSDKGGIAWGD